MAGSTISTWDALLKENYSDERLADLTATKCPTWGLLPKKTNFHGKRKVVPVVYGSNEGIGPTVSTAQAGLGSASAKDFLVTRKTLIGVSRLSRELLEVAKGDKFAFQDAADQEVTKTENRLIARLSQQLFGNAGGALGRLTSTSNTGTASVTLRSAYDAINFAPGMKVQCSDTNGTSGAVRAGTVTVASVNRTSGVITFTGNMTDGIGAAAASDYLFLNGTFGIAASGMSGWIPASDPTSGDSFHGVDRSVEPIFLAGVRATAAGGTVEDSLILAAGTGAQFGAAYTHAIMNPVLMTSLVRELGSKAMYVKTDSMDTAVGSKLLSIAVPTQNQIIKCVADPYCPSATVFMIDKDTWAIESSGQAPHIQTNDGVIAFPVADDDSVEMRMAAYWNLICYNPGANLRCDGF